MKVTTILLCLLPLFGYSQDALERERLRHVDRLLKTMINLDTELDSIQISRIRIKAHLSTAEFVVRSQEKAIDGLETDYKGILDRYNDQVDTTNYYKGEEHKWRVENRYNEIAKKEVKKQRNWFALITGGLLTLVGYLLRGQIF